MAAVTAAGWRLPRAIWSAYAILLCTTQLTRADQPDSLSTLLCPSPLRVCGTITSLDSTNQQLASLESHQVQCVSTCESQSTPCAAEYTTTDAPALVYPELYRAATFSLGGQPVSLGVAATAASGVFALELVPTFSLSVASYCIVHYVITPVTDGPQNVNAQVYNNTCLYWLPLQTDTVLTFSWTVGLGNGLQYDTAGLTLQFSSVPTVAPTTSGIVATTTTPSTSVATPVATVPASSSGIVTLSVVTTQRASESSTTIALPAGTVAPTATATASGTTSPVTGAVPTAASDTVIVVSVNSSMAGVAVSPTFAGLSHEWSALPYANASQQGVIHPAYASLITTLQSAGNSSYLVLRFGGNSADLQLRPPSINLLKQLAGLYQLTGTRYILGLNFKAYNVSLDLAQIQAIQSVLPTSALLSYELGNEPSGWYTNISDYIAHSGVTMAAIAQSGNASVPLAGPAWMGGSMPVSYVTQLLASVSRYMNLFTMHYYISSGTNSTTATIKTLLNQTSIIKPAAALQLAADVQLIQQAGLPSRYAEMNSFSNGGTPNVSDTFAAALWTADIMCDLVVRNIIGVNFHGGGGTYYSAIAEVRDASGAVNPQVRAPYYGLLMFQMASKNRAVLSPMSVISQSTINVRAWQFVDSIVDHELRVLLLNKDMLMPTRVLVRNLTTASAVGRLWRLKAPTLDERYNITLAGQTYWNTSNGTASGTQVVERVTTDQGGTLNVTLGVAEALLIAVPIR